MNKILMVMLLMIFSVTVSGQENSEEKEKFDASQYEDLYDDYIVGKMWELNKELSNTRMRHDRFMIKIVPKENKYKEGRFYERFAYIRGHEMSTTKKLKVEELPESEPYSYIVYDSFKGNKLEMVRIDEEGRMVMDMARDAFLVFEVADMEDNGCRKFESELDCLKRLDPEKYMEMRRKDFERRSEAANQQ